MERLNLKCAGNLNSFHMHMESRKIIEVVRKTIRILSSYLNACLVLRRFSIKLV